MVNGYLFFIPNLIILFWLALFEVFGLLLGIIIVYWLYYWIAKNLGCYHVVLRGKINEETKEPLPEESAKDR